MMEIPDGIDIRGDFFSRLLDMLEQQLGSTSEIVLHDLTRDYAHTIIDIRNNQITGRQIGGTGSNLGLEVLKGTNEHGDKYNYVTLLPDGRTLRSSSMYFRDKNGSVIGALCINTEITETLKFETYLQSFNHPNLSGDEVSEVFVSEVGQLLDYLIQTAQRSIGKEPSEMTKQDRLDMLSYLDQKGVFLITKSGERVQEYLGISKYTLYTYLDIIRKEEKQKKAGR